MRFIEKNGIKKINIIYYNPINGDVICFDEYTDSYTHINGQIYKFPPSNYNFITNIGGTTEDLFESMIGLNGIIKKSDDLDLLSSMNNLIIKSKYIKYKLKYLYQKFKL